MQNKFIYIFIGLTLLLILVGGYFFYNAIFKDDISEEISSLPSEKQTKITSKSKPLLNPAGNNGQQSNNNHSTQNENNPKIKNNQLVVDQTLKTQNISNDSFKANNISAEIKEEAVLEITLIDLVQDKIVSNTEISFQYKLNQEKNHTKKYKSDSNGIVRFSSPTPGTLSFQLYISEFSVYHANVLLNRGLNIYKANLLKGGALEVRAFDIDGKVVNGLELCANNGRLNMPSQSFVFDKNKGTYLFPKMPIGSQLISFKAPSYMQTADFIVRVEVNQVTSLEVLMRPARIIYFELGNVIKPEHIVVIKGNSLPNKNQDSNQSEIKDVFKNQNQLYELVLDDPRCTSVIVNVDKYLPQVVLISDETDTYVLKLKPVCSGELQITNEEGKPIGNASVNYRALPNGDNNSLQGNEWQSVISGKDGKAILNNLFDKMLLSISIDHKEYIVYKEDWVFDSNNTNAKKTILKPGAKISGKILYKGQGVSGAKVELYRVGNNLPVLETVSGADGNYYLDFRTDTKDGENFIRAQYIGHGDGFANVKVLDNLPVVLNIMIASGKSLSIKLVDNAGAILPNKQISLKPKCVGFVEPINILTNEKGEYDFLDLENGIYTLSMLDEKLNFNEFFVQVPTSVVTIVANPKKVIKIKVNLPNGGIYNGVLNIQSNQLEHNVNLISKPDGFYYFESNDFVNVILIEVSGYPVVVLDTKDEQKIMINELIVNLKESSSLKVVVLDEVTLKPIVGASVELFLKNVKVQSLPTNEYGEIQFKQLSGKLNLMINAKNFVSYNKEIDVTIVNEITIKLVKGGQIKGRITFSQDAVRCQIFLCSQKKYILVMNSDGSFLIKDILPGEYSVFFQENFKDGNMVQTDISTKIVIEADKVLEINLDDYKKK